MGDLLPMYTFQMVVFLNLLMIKEGYAFYFPHHDLEKDMAKKIFKCSKDGHGPEEGFLGKDFDNGCSK